MQLLLEPLCAGLGSQFHMSILSDACGGRGTYSEVALSLGGS